MARALISTGVTSREREKETFEGKYTPPTPHPIVFFKCLFEKGMPSSRKRVSIFHHRVVLAVYATSSSALHDSDAGLIIYIARLLESDRHKGQKS